MLLKQYLVATTVYVMSVGGPTVVIRLRNAGWWQTMMTLSAAAGGSYRSRTRAGNKIWVL